jgi:hypothetical protein
MARIDPEYLRNDGGRSAASSIYGGMYYIKRLHNAAPSEISGADPDNLPVYNDQPVMKCSRLPNPGAVISGPSPLPFLRVARSFRVA